MNIDIYNKKVAQFQLEVNELEKRIIHDAIPMANIFDFNTLKKEVEILLNEYTSIYESIANLVNRQQLLEYLETENNFLTLLVSMLNHLNHYHNVIGFVENAQIEREWIDVKKVLSFNYEKSTIYKKLAEKLKSFTTPSKEPTPKDNQEFFELKDQLTILESSKDMDEAFNRIEKLGNSEASLQEKNDEIEKLKKLGKETIASLEHFFEMEEIEYEEDAKINIETIAKDQLQVDEEYLNTLSYLPDKIEYIKKIISNIEKMPGKKVSLKYKETKKRISSKYQSKWLKCQSLLNKYVNEMQEDINEMTPSTEETIYLKKEYSYLYEDYKMAEKELFTLVQNAKNEDSQNLIAVASFNKEPLYISKNDLEKFNQIFVLYKKYQNRLNRFALENHFDIIDTKDKLETIEEAELKIYKEIKSLEKQSTSFESKEKIKTLKEKLARFNKGKKLALFANLKMKLKSLTNDEKKQEVLLSIAENPEKLIESEDYTKEEKKTILEKIMKCLKVSDKEQKETLLERQLLKIKKCFHILPKKEKHVRKIMKVREAKNKQALAGALSAMVIGTAILGISSLTNTTLLDANPIKNEISNDDSVWETKEDYQYFNIIEMDNKTNTSAKEVSVDTIEEKKLIQKDLLEEDKNPHDFGDTFTTTGIIYKNQNDMANEEKEVKTYFDALSTRKIGGIVYDYNGEKITIFDTDTDAEAKKTALEKNGAKQIGYVGRNKNANYKGYEGFFNENDVNFSNEEEEIILGGGR